MITSEHVTNKGQGTTRIPNKLGGEKSPYLLQHQYNPVDWYPWSEEAFSKAKEVNKPIFLSIGYSTCHWCHQMSRESFEDEEVAELLNKNFVSIKVDKEERPDIDNVYMTICQAITGHGGWPLTIIMTPNAEPFYATTYLPKNTGYGLIGLMDLLSQIHDNWLKDPDDMIETGNKITQIMKNEFEGRSDKAEVTKDLVGLAFTQLKDRFDHDYGGFGNEPKFPTPHNLLFLLAYSNLEADETSLFMVENTLTNMYKGGIYDHIGYGFSRYSTDAKWLVPHFEKMLYDNALLAIAYLETYQHTKNPLYKTIATQVLEYVRREMTDREGGYCFAQLAFLGTLYPSKEIICVVNYKDDNITTAKTVKRNPQENPEFEDLKEYMASHYNPNMIVLVKTKQNEEELLKIADYVGDYQTIDDNTTYYICENHHCQTPVTNL